MNRLSSSFNSSVTYSKSWGSNYNLTVGARHSQNTNNQSVSISLPEINFSVGRFYPLRAKNKEGKLKWYENISMKYTLEGKNQYSDIDSLLFKNNWTDRLRNGLSHSTSISSDIKLLKFFNWNNTINIRDRMYSYSFRRMYRNEPIELNKDTSILRTDTLRGFNNEIDFAYSSGITTKIYGQINMKKGLLRAVRHVITPSVSFVYSPDFSDPAYGYYRTIVNPYNKPPKPEKYYIYDDIFGSPSSMKSGEIRFNITNNLEIKVRDRKDTITGMRKIKLIENFNINGGYNFAIDSLNLSKIQMSGRTTLFNNFNITYNSVWDPYVKDSSGIDNLNRFEWDVNRRLLRLESTNWSLGFNYTMNNETFKKKKFRNNEANDNNGVNQNESAIEAYSNSQPDIYGNYQNKLPGQDQDEQQWGIPWSLTLSYNLNYGVNHYYRQYVHVPQKSVVQTLNVTGQVQLTKKWRVNVSTGWDFERSELSSNTGLDIYRDLHCWEMRFNWIPVGYYKSWRFGINVKASFLQDLKLEKKKDFRDKFNIRSN
ncbi:MAG: putative LPS assembly protein LptD [Bacteroidales bacterium]